MISKMFFFVLKCSALAAAIPACLYVILLVLLTTTWFQTHAVYLHKIQRIGSKDLNVPEMFGFLRNQVTPFNIKTEGSESVYAWHVLPLGLYREHEKQLQAEPAGWVPDFQSRLAFKLLLDDPEARLVIHMHGAAGTVGSGYRPANYRALSAEDSRRIHVLAFDYRGFGRSSGTPSEQGVIADALAVVDWAIKVAKIPPSRIIIFAQSIGTAVNMAIAEHYLQHDPPVLFAGHILVAGFVDVPTLASTYWIEGTIPLLGPLAGFPKVFEYVSTFIRDKWPTKDRIAYYVRTNEADKNNYHLTLIHAEDDWDIQWQHTSTLFWHAVNATFKDGFGQEKFKRIKSKSMIDLGAAGTVVEWRTDSGVIREEILKYGLHDVIMGNPVITLAAMRIFEESR